jgi:hypothetical protein
MSDQPTEDFVRRAVRDALDGAEPPAVDFAALAGRAHRRRQNLIVGAVTLAVLGCAGMAFALSGSEGRRVPGVDAGSPRGAAVYCPPAVEGAIRWPSIDDQWLNAPAPTGAAVASEIPASPVPPAMWDGHTRIPFPANIVIVCRYTAEAGGRLIGSGLSTDPATVSSLEAAANTATVKVTGDECAGRGQALVIFGAAGNGTTLFLDLTSCDVWLMPDSVRIHGSFVHDIEALAATG